MHESHSLPAQCVHVYVEVREPLQAGVAPQELTTLFRDRISHLEPMACQAGEAGCWMNPRNPPVSHPWQ